MSRSTERRIALQKGKTMPQYPANPIDALIAAAHDRVGESCPINNINACGNMHGPCDQEQLCKAIAQAEEYRKGKEPVHRDYNKQFGVRVPAQAVCSVCDNILCEEGEIVPHFCPNCGMKIIWSKP